MTRSAVVAGVGLAAWLMAVAGALLTRGEAGLALAWPALKIALFLGVIVLALVWLRERSRNGNRDLFRPGLIFPAAYAVWFALGSMDLVKPDPLARLWDPMPLWIPAMALVGLVAYALGLAAAGRAPNLPPSPGRVREALAGWRPARVRFTLIALAAVMLVGYLAITRQSGVPLLADNPAVARMGIGENGVLFAVFYSAVLALVPMSLLWLWAGTPRSKAERRAIYALNGVLLILLLGLGVRGFVLQPALLALLVAHYARRQIRLRNLVVVVAAGALFLSVYGLYRDVRSYGPAQVVRYDQWGFPVWSLPFTYIYTYVRDPVATFREVTAMIPRFVDYQYGAILASPFVTALPGYQESSDLFFRRILRNEFIGAGRPATLLGSLYADLGVAGIIAGMVLFGLLSQFLYRRYLRQLSGFRLLLHVWVLHVALLSLFSSLLPYTVTVFVPILLWLWTQLVAQPHVHGLRQNASAVPALVPGGGSPGRRQGRSPPA